MIILEVANKFPKSCDKGDKEKNVSYRNYLNGQAEAFEFIRDYATEKLGELEVIK